MRNDHHSIRGYVEFNPYFKAVGLALECELKETTTIGRTHLIDILNSNPEYLDIIKDYKLDLPQGHYQMERVIAFERRIWTVLGIVMLDHGWHKCSKKAWAREGYNGE